jgi:hypothetical protein
MTSPAISAAFRGLLSPVLLSVGLGAPAPTKEGASLAGEVSLRPSSMRRSRRFVARSSCSLFIEVNSLHLHWFQTGLDARAIDDPVSMTRRPYGVVNCAPDRSHKSYADAHGRQSYERDVVLSEEIEAARAALEYADVPFAIGSHASRGLDHRPTAVRTGGGFEHAE